MSERRVCCADCGTPYPFPLDTVLPNEQWKAIGGEEAGILCETCILRRAERLPGVTVARLYLEGIPIHGADKALEEMRIALSNAALAEFQGQPLPTIDRMDLYRWWETLHARELEHRGLRAEVRRLRPPPPGPPDPPSPAGKPRMVA